MQHIFQSSYNLNYPLPKQLSLRITSSTLSHLQCLTYHDCLMLGVENPVILDWADSDGRLLNWISRFHSSLPHKCSCFKGKMQNIVRYAKVFWWELAFSIDMECLHLILGEERNLQSRKRNYNSTRTFKLM